MPAVTSFWGVESGRRRRYYRLTVDGTKALASQLGEWRRLVSAVDVGLAAGPPG